MKTKKREIVLYISYDGLLEPLGESQVVNYLLGLSRDYHLYVMSYEKPRTLGSVELVRRMERTLAQANIRWIRLTYHKWPPVLSTLIDVAVGILLGLSLCLTERIRVLHARSYVPALIAFVLKRLTMGRFLFDMRGFWPDEKVEAAHWRRESVVYWLAKRCERMFLQSADAIVSLTAEGAKRIPTLAPVRAGTPIEVIPTCTDLDRFSPGPKDPVLMRRLGLEGRRVIGCVGTMHNWYLRKPMLDYMAYLVQHLEGTKILVVTLDNHQQLWADARAAGLPADRLVVTMSDFSAMPEHIRLMDFGFFFIEACFAKKGSNPTKLGEFLACGVPVIINDGVGDSGWIVRQHRVGVVLRDTAPSDFAGSIPAVQALFEDQGVRARCRETADRYFNLEMGVRKYDVLYQELVGKRASARQAC